MIKPKIVCLCGSTKFYDEFMRANFEETMKGNIVLSVGFFHHYSGQKVDWKSREHSENIGISREEKIFLDELHKKKIDLADEILIINKNGYIGESTASEIAYASYHLKTIRFLEPQHWESYLKEGIFTR